MGILSGSSSQMHGLRPYRAHSRRFAIFSSKTNLWSVFCNTHFKQLFEGKTAPGRTPGSLTQLQSWIGASQGGIGVLSARGFMKSILITLTITFFSAAMTQAQSESIPNDLPLTHIQPPHIIPVQVEPAQQESHRVLPDAPIPIIPNIQDGPLPCPAGIGKPCPLLGGRRYFRDPSHMTEHDATWGKAMRNPMMVAGGLLNLASTIADIEGTQACLHAHTCTEGNPLFGANPSRTRAYGIGIPLGFAIYSMSAWLKKNGEGNLAFGLLWGGTIIHTYEAAHGYTITGKGSPAKPNSPTGQSFGIIIKF